MGSREHLKVVCVQLATGDVPTSLFDPSKSSLLTSITTHSEQSIFVFISPDTDKDESLRLFVELEPLDGGFTLELGTQLPDLMPNINGNVESVVPVCLPTEESRDLCISNAMSLVRYTKEGTDMQALSPRCAVSGIRNGDYPMIPKDANVEALKTFVTSRYALRGTTADAAIEDGCKNAVDDFIARINAFLSATQIVHPDRMFAAAYSVLDLPPLYFLVVGASGATRHGRLSPHLGRSFVLPSDLDPESSRRLLRILSGAERVDDIERLLSDASAISHSGSIYYVLLLSVIASEVATTRYIEKRLIQCGVSKGKLDETDGFKYSQLLNVVLFAVTPPDHKPDRQLIGEINRARELRNKYMHEGLFLSSRDEVRRLLESAKKYVAYIRKLELHEAGTQ